MPIASGFTFWRWADSPASTAGHAVAPVCARYSACACFSRASAWACAGLFASASSTAAFNAPQPNSSHHASGTSAPARTPAGSTP